MTEPTRDPTGLNGGTAPLAERLLFESRMVVIVIFVLLTVFFGYHASKLEPDASFEKMVPTSHPYIQNYLKNRADLKSLGNSIRIIVETTEGDIFDEDFQDALPTAMTVRPGSSRNSRRTSCARARLAGWSPTTSSRQPSSRL